MYLVSLVLDRRQTGVDGEVVAVTCTDGVLKI